jgi:ribonuclease Z
MGHSTVRVAAGYGESLGVKNLILVHGSDDDLPHRKAAYTQEAQTVYHGNIFVPYDLETIELT